MSRSTEDYGIQVDLMQPQYSSEYVIYERFFGGPFHNDIHPRHEWPSPPVGASPLGTGTGILSLSEGSLPSSPRGRPPRTFFCHKSPSEYSPSHSDSWP